MAKNKFQISTRTMLSRIEKLNLAPGDVIVVKDHETLGYLAQVKLPIPFTVPLVYSPQGIQKLSKQDLLNLLEQLEQTDKSVLPEYGLTEQPGAPL